MRRGRVLVAALALVAPWVVAAPAGAAVEVPQECAVPPEIADLSQFHVVIGTNASERLEGTDGPDFICGLLGDDVIEAGGGGDIVLGDTSTFFGNVQAAGGADRITGGAGDDLLVSGPGDDTVNGGAGDDMLNLAVGDDTGQGGGGADLVIGGFGRDVVVGGAGPDQLAGGPGDDLVNGGPGADVLFGEIPDSAPLPPGTAPGTDRCIGAGGFDVAADCDRTSGVEAAA
jgi:Ca2+-binding RTX toxin-like protein